MIHSMTGYGAGTTTSPNYKVTVELKSLNNKYIEIGLKLSRSYLKYEGKLRSLLSDQLQRGKVALFLNVEVLNPEKRSLNINQVLIKSYIDELNAVRKNFGIDAKIELPFLLDLPEIMSNHSSEVDAEEWDLVQEACKIACVAMLESRAEEGEALAVDLQANLVAIGEGLKEVEKLAPVRIERVRSRVKQALEDIKVRIEHDQNRFEQELLFYIEKLDINEEIVRLRQHLVYFKKILEENENTGKKLNFIAQEMGREINTIGSKAQNADIQRHVIGMKDRLEKIKEQILNVV